MDVRNKIPKTPDIEVKKDPVKMRQIVIETDGNSVRLVNADVAGQIELIAILDGLSSFLKAQKKP